MRGRSSLLLVLLAHFACGPPAEPQADTAITLEPRPAQESPGPPTTLRLVLQLQPDGRVQLISTHPRRGSVGKPPDSGTRQDAIDGRVRLIEYTARDKAGAVVATGRFTVPAIAVAEFQDPDVATQIRGGEQPLTTSTVMVSIPYQPSIATIAFRQLEPNRDAPIEAWQGRPLGEVPVEPSSARPEPQQETPPPPKQQR